MLEVIDHTEARWLKEFQRKAKVNGAATYSEEIVRLHLPLWQEKFKDATGVISTCPLLIGRETEFTQWGDVAIQYLHTYNYVNPCNQALAVLHGVSGFQKIIFVTAYKALHVQLQALGITSVYLPMTIEKTLPAARHSVRGGNSAAYWGNITLPKKDLWHSLKDEFRDNGWTLIHVSMSQSYGWAELTRYDYGVGVGRCALEMMDLGLKVMVAGAEFGGLITTESEYDVHEGTNFNGRVTTFDRNVASCLAAWPSVPRVPFRNGTELALETLKRELEKL